MSGSLISSEVDFDNTGKHVGFLRLPHSVHHSAYGFIPVPVVSVRGAEGPVVLLVAGNHGDEYEGQVALSRLAQELRPEDVTGQVIILTMANFPAAQAGKRVSPVDEGNLNRSFPGAPHGSPTEMMAHYIEEVLLPRCDYAVDLHSGGSSLFYPATLLRGQGWDKDEAKAIKRMQEAFDLPYAWVFQGGGGPSSTARTLMGGANRKGVVAVMTELGGGGAVTPDILADTERGLRRWLHGMGCLPGYQPDGARGTRELKSVGLVYAYDAGVFEPLKEIGEDVCEGDVIGFVHTPETPWAEAVEIKAQAAGVVMALRVMGRCARGDALFQVGVDLA
ncbi:succinylglutamate desuccinylase/aspartoacylase family protein [Alisedimentitalea sp. MJ-SS2]|uniref:succinylglutamate desuccinylase/aspartoacylase family protein n=1 Tax=Aliisedimentitalea sp. MJ-SS2 TaxID=3049795 RepID=UPI00290D5757|nr:succinylglutamate desuccinylase/aspartoacylase family protein [Alisedimentitalea sp. MJ-SS2]MDU8926521.1 succinylglutamate desuccinylase/aspartoacylase family protein [Alisedimentitalea sp. MJ-SS2]